MIKKVTGITAEFDPFHNGHRYLLDCVGKSDICEKISDKEKPKCASSIAGEGNAFEYDDERAIMVVMSGAFTQRGAPSFYDKRLRAEAALRNGADLVVELPYVYACNTADIFADGSIRIMADSGVVDEIFFGRECEDENLLIRAAKIMNLTEPEHKSNGQAAVSTDDLSDSIGSLSDSTDDLSDSIGGLSDSTDDLSDSIGGLSDSTDDLSDSIGGLSDSTDDLSDSIGGLSDSTDDLSDAKCTDHLPYENDSIELFQRRFKRLLKKGLSYPAALCRAAGEAFGAEIEHELRQPNNILAVRYINAVKKHAPYMDIRSVLREGDGHNVSIHEEGSKASAMMSGTSLRKAVSMDDKDTFRCAIPKTAYDIFSGEDFCRIGEDFYKLLRHKIITSKKWLKNIYLVSEGIENRLFEAAYSSETFEEFISRVRTRRYTDSRLMRIFSHILMNFTYDDYEEIKDVSYLRILGFTDNGAKILSDIRKNSDITIISNLSKLRYLPEKIRKSVEIDMRAVDVRNILMSRKLADYSDRKYKPVRV